MIVQSIVTLAHSVFTNLLCLIPGFPVSNEKSVARSFIIFYILDASTLNLEAPMHAFFPEKNYFISYHECHRVWYFRYQFMRRIDSILLSTSVLCYRRIVFSSFTATYFKPLIFNTHIPKDILLLFSLHNQVFGAHLII